MIYASFTIHDGDFAGIAKIVAETLDAYNDHKAYIEKELGFTITDEFVDTDVGTVVILPEDFKY